LFLYIRICKGVVLVSMCIFYLFDLFLFSVLEKREKIWHWDKPGFRFGNCEITICTAALLSNVKYSLTFPPFIFTFVAKSIFLLSDIMATTDFLLKQSTTNNRHVQTHKNPSQFPLDYIASLATFVYLEHSLFSLKFKKYFFSLNFTRLFIKYNFPGSRSNMF
jgi:hypothetical protein